MRVLRGFFPIEPRPRKPNQPPGLPASVIAVSLFAKFPPPFLVLFPMISCRNLLFLSRWILQLGRPRGTAPQSQFFREFFPFLASNPNILKI